MKIAFRCPFCQEVEQIRVLAVGWTRLQRRCAKCGRAALHDYRQFPAAGLGVLGAFASWGLALLLGSAFELSFDAVLVIVLVAFGVLAFFFTGKVVDLCSSWKPVREERQGEL
jgi:hypothetical protein